MISKTKIWISITLGTLLGCFPVPRQSVKHININDIPIHSNILPKYQDLTYPKMSYTPPLGTDFKILINDSISIYYVPDTSLDLVSFTLYLDRSNLPSSLKEKTILELLEQLYIEGGSKSLTPQKIQDSIEFNAASLSVEISESRTTLKVTCLKDYFPAMLDLLGSAVLEPGLDSAQYTWAKKSWMEGLQHRWDRPQAILGVAYEKVMYGNNPRGWIISPKNADSISLSLLRPYTQFAFSTSKVIGAFSGPQPWKDVEPQLKKFSSHFLQTNFKNGISDPAPKKSSAGLYIVDRDLTQSQIQIGFPGLQRPHPDYYPLMVASTIFGSGGFTSRLVKTVRTEAGLAYSVRSFVDGDYRRPGTVGIALQTKAQSSLDAIQLCFKELKLARDSGFTKEEWQWAKKSLLQSVPGYFDTPAGTAELFAENELLGRSPAHFREYMQILDTLSLETIEKVFNKYFDPDSARIVVVGPSKTVEQTFDPSHHDLVPWKSAIKWSLGELDAF